MPINWKSTDTYQRLLAAVYAASPQNHNYHAIATMFGEGATYDSIEGRFRIIKREAAKLKAEVEGGVRGEAPVRGGGVKQRRETKKKQGVLTGRVTKKAAKKVKGEEGTADQPVEILDGDATERGREGGRVRLDDVEEYARRAGLAFDAKGNVVEEDADADGAKVKKYEDGEEMYA